MKKLIAATLAGALALSLGACNTPQDRALGGAGLGALAGAAIGGAATGRAAGARAVLQQVEARELRCAERVPRQRPDVSLHD